MAFGERCTIFNPFNGNVFIEHQSCLNKYKNIFIAQIIQQRVFSRFSLDIFEIELLHYITVTLIIWKGQISYVICKFDAFLNWN